MRHEIRRWTAQAAALGVASALMLGCGSDSPTAPAASRFVVSSGTDGNFATVAAALNAAPEGEVIEIRGTIGERVVINKPGIKLRGAASAAVDGSRLDGRGIGIHVVARGVEVSGLIVRNFERGIVVEGVADALVQNNEVHSSNSKTANSAPPLAPGVDLFEGVVLIGATNAQVTNNILRNNGHDGLMIMGGSRNNLVRNNRVLDNGAQTAPGLFGCGINVFSGTENTGNQIVENEVTGNHWGILLHNFTGNTGNIVRNNRVRNNGRAGIAALLNASGNTIQDNDARDNGTLNIAPTLSFDLFDAPPLNNTWQNNQGRFNFAAGTTLTAAEMKVMFSEAYGPGGCLRGMTGPAQP
jgi:parallel beta-helix repeat protein